MRKDRHGIIQTVVLLCALAFAIVYVSVSAASMSSAEPGGEAPSVSEWGVRSEDGSLLVEWEEREGVPIDDIRIEVLDGDTKVYEDTVEGRRRSASFEGGEHGKLYTVRVTPIGRDATEGETQERQALFLDYDRLPDLPLITIDTSSGEDPTFDVADKPDDDLWGATITNNDSLGGRMTLSGTGGADFTSELDIGVRGNTSNLASGTGKYSYRLELESPYALPGREREASDDWALLNVGDSIRTYVGDWVGDQCGMEWQPHLMFVNLMLNGDWKGTYCLTPTVSAPNSHDLVSRTGYIFEADSYWWNADGIYFRTDAQIPQVAFTFKYPRMKDEDDKHIARLRDYMQRFEDLLIAGDPSYGDYIDEESFARWMLARDILGNVDAGGTNVYYYKYDYDTADPTSSKVKMGPLWDHDTDFLSWGEWSYSRSEDMTYFPWLFQQGSFERGYQELWEAIGPTIGAAANDMLQDLGRSQGDALDASWRLEMARWGTTIPSFEDQRRTVSLWFEARTPWIYNALSLEQPSSAALDVSSFSRVEGGAECEEESQEPLGDGTVVRGWAYLDDPGQASRYTIPGILVGDRVYLANDESRPDVQAERGLESDMVGYYACLDEGVSGRPCVVDIQNETLYL